LALFNKAVRKLNGYLKAVVEADVEQSMPGGSKQARYKAARAAEKMAATGATLEDDLKDGSGDAYRALTGKKHSTGAAGAAAEAATALLLADEELARYAVKGGDTEWEGALAAGARSSVSMKAGTVDEQRSVPDRVASAAQKAPSTGSVERLLAEATAEREETAAKGQSKKRRRILGGGFNETADVAKKAHKKKPKAPKKPEGKYKNM